MKVFGIVGLPGSGKTHYAKTMSSHLEGIVILIDDIERLEQLPEKNTFDILIITDVQFCIKSIREKANDYIIKKYGIGIEFIFFENNPSACSPNVRFRNDGRKVEYLIHDMSKKYEIPKDVNPLKIWLA